MFRNLISRFIKNNYLDEIVMPKEEEKMLKTYNKIIKSNPDNPNSYFDRGNLRFKLGNYLGAMKDYNIAIRLNPEYLKAYHGRAITKERLDYYNGAIDDYNFILKMDSLDLLAHKNKNIIQQKF